MASPTMKAMNHMALSKPQNFGKRKRASARVRLAEKIKKRRDKIEADPEKAERERQKRVSEYLAKKGTPTGLMQS